MHFRIGDFFCGVGGIRLGFERSSSSYVCVFSNDIDKQAVKTYEKNFPSHKVTQKSISELTNEDVPDIDIFIGGFPCQPFSIAGNLRGFEDERGNLFFDIVRILEMKRPIAFLLENVKNLKTHDNGNTYKTIKKALCGLGYTFKTKIMNTTEYGNLPQNRERIFIVGFLHRDMTEKFTFPKPIPLTVSVSDLLESDVDKRYYYTEKSAVYPKVVECVKEHVSTNQIYQYRRHYVRENKSGVCPTLTANMGGGGHNVPIIKDDIGIRKLTPRECFNLQGFHSDYELPKGISDSALYKQAGNSVSVPVIQRIAENILSVFLHYRERPLLIFD
jgi:DNA (cytosine-5)-methyltransferase 1